MLWAIKQRFIASCNVSMWKTFAFSAGLLSHTTCTYIWNSAASWYIPMDFFESFLVSYMTANFSHIGPFQNLSWRLKEGRNFNLGNYLELVCSFLNSISVLTIYHIDKPVCIVEVMPPQWSQLLLTTNIPNSEKHILVLYFLHIETCTPCYSFLVRYLYCYESFGVNHQMLCSFEHTWNYSLIYLIYFWILFMPSHTHC